MTRKEKIQALQKQLEEIGSPNLLKTDGENQRDFEQSNLIRRLIDSEREAMRIEAESLQQKETAESFAKAAEAIAQLKNDQENGLISLNHLVGELAKVGGVDYRADDYKSRSEEARQQVQDAISAKHLIPRKRSTLFPIKSLPIPWPSDAVVNEEEITEWLLGIGATLPSRFNRSVHHRAALPPSPKRPELRKNGALVREFSKIWPSIERDIKDKTRHANEQLNKANVSHGYYDVEMALTWAKTEGKITKDKAESYVSSANDSILTAMIGQIFSLN